MVRFPGSDASLVRDRRTGPTKVRRLPKKQEPAGGVRATASCRRELRLSQTKITGSCKHARFGVLAVFMDGQKVSLARPSNFADAGRERFRKTPETSPSPLPKSTGEFLIELTSRSIRTSTSSEGQLARKPDCSCSVEIGSATSADRAGYNAKGRRGARAGIRIGEVGSIR